MKEFIQRIKARAVTKRKEMDEARAKEIREKGIEADGAVDVADIPLEQRLGPGGLDPLEVFESLPESMQEAFESREKEKLEAALRAMTPEEAGYHMKRCVDSGVSGELSDVTFLFTRRTELTLFVSLAALECVIGKKNKIKYCYLQHL